MAFYADLHVHSRFSRATSRDSDLEHMALWARRKGIGVLGTGDFTHPEWFREIETKLVPAEPGLFRLRPDLEAQVDGWLSAGGARVGGEAVRFLLEVEISTIYKQGDRTRKVHHCLYAPDLDKARKLNASLARIGNLASDGRPILGLDSRNLLEITLAAGEGCYLIPAHIWTPWFAALGSKSGFDSIEECYGDLAGEIFAVETGLSSDPPMNWRLSKLDRFTLVSSSDAHSPPKIGREASAFECELDYFAMREALRTGNGYGGTCEFFPEEGKYHFDGHRKCGVCIPPEASRQSGGACPVCGKPLTLGVLYRVNELADRDEGAVAPRTYPFRNLVPLEEVLAEIEGVGAASKAVQERYTKLLQRLGDELFILEKAPLDDVERAGSALLSEALLRMRAGRVLRHPGYDGEYGTIRLFEADELERRSYSSFIVDLGVAAPPPTAPPAPTPPAVAPCVSPSPAPLALPSVAPSAADRSRLLDGLDAEQRALAELVHGPLEIVAGPGTGKTRTLTHRLAHIVLNHGVLPERCLAITFTRRAAEEMRSRLEVLLPAGGGRVDVATFHSLGLSILREEHGRLGFQSPPKIASEEERRAIVSALDGTPARGAERVLGRLSRLRRGALPEASREDAAQLAAYIAALRSIGAVDFDDLIALPVELLEGAPETLAKYRARWGWIAVDEFQDIDPWQYRLVGLLAPPGGNLCVIGDPDQAIYGFRGADVRCFERFRRDFPTAATVHLTRNYRSTSAIVEAAVQVITPTTLVAERKLFASGDGPERIEIHELPSDRAEAVHIAQAIEELVGGSSLHAFDSGRVASHAASRYSFADFAVLYRTDAIAQPVAEALGRAGIPFQRRSHDRLGDLPCVQSLVKALLASAASSSSVVAGLDRAAAEVSKLNPEIGLYLPALRAMSESCGSDWRRFVSELALGLDADLWDPRAERVSLLTLHAAKGLEFPVVFILGVEDGSLPLRWVSTDDVDVAEERRLLFVGMTRARERLILTHARNRFVRGALTDRVRSPFLDEIHSQLVSSERRKTKTKPKPEFRQLTLFAEG